MIQAQEYYEHRLSESSLALIIFSNKDVEASLIRKAFKQDIEIVHLSKLYELVAQYEIKLIDCIEDPL